MKMSPSTADADSDTSESVETADTAAMTASSPAPSVLTSSSSSVLTSSTSSDHSSELGTSDTDQTQSDRSHGSNSASNTAKEEYNNNNNNNSGVIPPGDTLEYVLVTDNLSEPNLVVLDKSNDEVVDNSEANPGYSEANPGYSGDNSGYSVDNSTVISLPTPPDRSSASVMHISQTRYNCLIPRIVRFFGLISLKTI